MAVNTAFEYEEHSLIYSKENQIPIEYARWSVACDNLTDQRVFILRGCRERA